MLHTGQFVARIIHQQARPLQRDLFGDRPIARALAAEHEGVLVGYAITFVSYSTFKTRRCTFLEDLYVTPAHRGTGLGAALLRAVAALAAADGSARLQWNVLDWNTPAIEFYERLGATVLADWRVCQVEGEGIARLAAGG